MVDRGRLLSGCRGNTSTVGSNPTLPADKLITEGPYQGRTRYYPCKRNLSFREQTVSSVCSLCFSRLLILCANWNPTGWVGKVQL